METKLNGEIKDNWHVYASDSVDGLSGITFSTLDSSIQIKSHEITTQSISYSDPVFEGRKKETYQQKIELSILVSYSIASLHFQSPCLNEIKFLRKN